MRHALSIAAAGILAVLPASALAGMLSGDHPKVAEGTAAYQRGDYEAALKAYEEAERELPGRPELQYNLGDAYMKLNRTDDARRAYSAALQSAPDSLKARDYYNLGNALAGLNQNDDAALAYRQALKVDPKFEPARHNLEVLLRGKQQKPPSKPSPGDGGTPDAGQDGGSADSGSKDSPDAGSDGGGMDGGSDGGGEDAGSDGGGADAGSGDGGSDGGQGDGGGQRDGGQGDGGGDAGGQQGDSQQQRPDAGMTSDGGDQDGGAMAEREPEKIERKNVSEEEAKKLLDALRRNEKQFLMMQHKDQKVRQRAHPEKDW